jgi:hypothetical protein
MELPQQTGIKLLVQCLEEIAMSTRLMVGWVACVTALSGPAAFAGTVKVTLVDKARYADVGSTPWEIESNLGTISSYLTTLGQRYLPENDVLNIDILDVDLAGTTQPSAQRGADLRIVRGGADWPRIALRYTLEASGQPARQGQESLSDMNYTRRLQTIDPSDPLHYEKRMLDDWFKQRFARSAAQ